MDLLKQNQGKQTSASEECSIGVPQGSVLGLLLFTAFISPVAKVVAHHSVQQHQYADDTTLYVSMSKSYKAQRVEDLQRCLQSLHEWFAQNGLALNPDKTVYAQYGSIKPKPQLMESILPVSTSNRPTS